MTEIETILLAEKYIKSGVNAPTLKDEEVKKKMKTIAANAVCIGLCKFNSFVIGNISDGDFESIKSGWKDARVGLEKCLAIINNEGQDINDILSLQEIEEAVRFTIFELETSEEDDE